jgi:peptidoglycan/LPS O-acetylase OafA/YrhL
LATVANRTHFPCFDGLRAIAAIAVLLLHAGFQSGYNSHGRFGELLSHGDVGVPIFFLISGFLLYRPFVTAHLDGRPPLEARRFFWNRFLRVAPAFWVALVLVSIFFGFQRGALHTPRDFVTYFGFGQIYDPVRFLGGINQAWSLGTEVSFYLFLPLYASAVHLVAVRSRSRVRVEIIGLVLMYVTSVAFRVAVFTADPYWRHMRIASPGAPRAALAASYWLPSYLDLFAMGMGLALLSAWSVRQTTRNRVVDLIGRRPWVWWLLAAVTFWIVCFQVGLPRDLALLTGRQLMVRQFLYGLTALFLLVPAAFGPPHRGGVRAFLQWRPIAYIGLVSYGVYLWQEAWIPQVMSWFNWYLFGGHLVLILVLSFAFTLATATLSYFIVERPALRLKSRMPFRRRAPAVSAP